MSIKEMHIDFGIKLSQLNAGVNRGFSTQEVDWYLNSAIGDWLEMLVSNKDTPESIGFQDNVITLSHVNSLCKTLSIPLHKETGEGFSASLPSLFLYYIAGEISVNKVTTVPLVSFPRTMAEVTIPVSGNTIPHFRIEVTYTKNSVTATYVLFNTRNYTSTVFSIDDLFVVVNLITEAATDMFSIYSETFEDVFFKNKILLVPNDYTNVVITSTVVIDSVLISTAVIHTKTLSCSNMTDTINRDMVVISPNSIGTKANNPFLTNSVNLLSTIIQQNKVKTVKVSNDVPKLLKLTYISKPKRVNYILGVNLEIGNNDAVSNRVAEHIVNLAVLKVGGVISAQNQEGLKQNFLLTN